MKTISSPFLSITVSGNSVTNVWVGSGVGTGKYLFCRFPFLSADPISLRTVVGNIAAIGVAGSNWL